MKKIFGVVILLAAFVCSYAQEVESGPMIVFVEDAWEFGDIHQGDKVEHTFEFENAGTEPLILSNVLTTCGCTASDWPREPIAPGELASLKVTFNSAGKIGMQNKIITIVSNATNSRERIKITTNVLPKTDQEG
ncbi:MAG: DUF1573 domain-containing protein [Cytophagales bacterium]|nr:DUF1573 domain-containing protein [Cytophagales bacterium]